MCAAPFAPPRVPVRVGANEVAIDRASHWPARPTRARARARARCCERETPSAHKVSQTRRPRACRTGAAPGTRTVPSRRTLTAAGCVCDAGSPRSGPRRTPAACDEQEGKAGRGGPGSRSQHDSARRRPAGPYYYSKRPAPPLEWRAVRRMVGMMAPVAEARARCGQVAAPRLLQYRQCQCAWGTRAVRPCPPRARVAGAIISRYTRFALALPSPAARRGTRSSRACPQTTCPWP